MEYTSDLLEKIFENSRMRYMYFNPKKQYTIQNYDKYPILHRREVIISRAEQEELLTWINETGKKYIELHNTKYPSIINAIKLRIIQHEGIKNISNNRYINSYVEILDKDSDFNYQFSPNLENNMIHTRYIIILKKSQHKYEGMPICNNVIHDVEEGSYTHILAGIHPYSNIRVDSEEKVVILSYGFLYSIHDIYKKLVDKKQIVDAIQNELVIHKRYSKLLPTSTLNTSEYQLITSDNHKLDLYKKIGEPCNFLTQELVTFLQNFMKISMQIGRPFEYTYNSFKFLNIHCSDSNDHLYKHIFEELTKKGFYKLHSMNVIYVQNGGFYIHPPRDTYNRYYICISKPDYGGNFFANNTFYKFNTYDDWYLPEVSYYGFSSCIGKEPLIILEIVFEK